MKKNELNLLKKKSIEELSKIVSEKKNELLKVVASMKAGKEKNLKKAKNLKIYIAKVMTVIRNLEIVSEMKGKEGTN